MSSLQWILAAIVCGAVEIFSAGFWFLWLSISALLVALGVSLGFLPHIEAQLLVFALFSSLFIIFTRPLVLKFFKTSETVSNVEALIGQHGIALSSITPLQYGQVKVKGEVWTAVSSQEIPPQQLVIVVGVDGVKLRVEAEES